MVRRSGICKEKPYQCKSACESKVALSHPEADLRFTKVRYRGLKKDHERLLAAFELVNLYQHRKRLAPPRAKCLCRPEIGLQRQDLPVNIAHSAASCTAVSTKLLTQFCRGQKL